MQHIVTVIGARPQFIKAAPVSQAVAQNGLFKEIIIHTGQHFDHNMSGIFFDELLIPKPDHFLNINQMSHGAMTGRMLEKIESLLLEIKPSLVLVYGDTNSTLAGALAAKKLQIAIGHIEAGLRSYNLCMPEEVNRVLTDSISDLLFCPTTISVNNLKNENVIKRGAKIIKVGDVMYDASLLFRKYAKQPSSTVNIKQPFILATVHREDNVMHAENLKRICYALNNIHNDLCRIIAPLHPRTKKAIDHLNITVEFDALCPQTFLEMQWLLDNCHFVITDSGGLQKEAYFYGKKCLVLRNETEWQELVQYGNSYLCGPDNEVISEKAKELMAQPLAHKMPDDVYGSGNAAQEIVAEIGRFLNDS